MTYEPISLLAIDDDSQVIDFVTDTLADEGLEIRGETDPHKGVEVALQLRPAIVLLDLTMPRLGGMEVLEKIMESAPDTEEVLFTGNYSTESAVEAVKKGASDYLEKPIPPDKLRQRMEQIFETIRRKQDGNRVEQDLAKLASFENMIGRSPAMQELFSRIRRLAPHFQTILLTGESGTGKELVARALHRLRAPASAPLAVCNCSAIPGDII